MTQAVDAAGASTAVPESAAEPVSETATQEVALPPDPFQLSRETISAIPGLGSAEQDVLTLFVCYVQCAGGGATDAESALLELELAKGWTKEHIVGSVQRVGEGLAAAWEELDSRYKSQTLGTPGNEQKIVSLDELASRFEQERREQDALRAKALGLLDMVREIRLKLGIPDLHAPTPPASQPLSPEGEKEGGLLAGLRRIASPLFVAEVDPQPQGAVTPPPLRPQSADWLTGPILDDSDVNIRKLSVIVYKRCQAQPDARVVWASIRNLGISDDEVKRLVNDVQDKAQRQLAQCDEVIRTVTSSYSGFAQEIEQVQRLRDILKGVIGFYSLK